MLKLRLTSIHGCFFQLESTNHPFRKEKDLPNLFHVNLQRCIYLVMWRAARFSYEGLLNLWAQVLDLHPKKMNMTSRKKQPSMKSSRVYLPRKKRKVIFQQSPCLVSLLWGALPHPSGKDFSRKFRLKNWKEADSIHTLHLTPANKPRTDILIIHSFLLLMAENILNNHRLDGARTLFLLGETTNLNWLAGCLPSTVSSLQA